MYFPSLSKFLLYACIFYVSEGVEKYSIYVNVLFGCVCADAEELRHGVRLVESRSDSL
jgi:hypothetical protein